MYANKQPQIVTAKVFFAIAGLTVLGATLYAATGALVSWSVDRIRERT